MVGLVQKGEGNVVYVKLFSDIIHSSIWAQDAETCKVWVTMLALSNRDGIVKATAPGISGASRVSIERTREILKALAEPDPDSRTPDNDGRRIQDIDGGFQILNYTSYRDIHSLEQRRSRDRERQKRKRERDASRDNGQTKGQSIPECHVMSRDSHVTVTPLSRDCHGVSHHTDTDTDTDTKEEDTESIVPISIPSQEFKDAWNAMAALCEPPKGKTMPTCERISARRREKLTTRSDDPWWRESWRKALERIPDSAFLTGHNDRGWMADPEWFLRSSESAVKIMEGKYHGGEIVRDYSVPYEPADGQWF